MTTAWPLRHKDPGSPSMLPLDHAPGRFYVSRAGRYAHLVRSAAIGRPMWADGAEVVTVNAFCGQWGSTRRGTFLDEPGEFPVCGTCLGRDLGMDDGHPDIAFRPTKSLAGFRGRIWCPGPRKGLWLEIPGTDISPTTGKFINPRAYCILCGHRGKTSAGGGVYAPTWSMSPHRLEVAEAVDYCPTCGWEHLYLRSDTRTMHCRAHGCDWSMRFEFQGE